MSAPVFPAFRFDGRHADAVPVLMRIDHHHLIVETTEGTVLHQEQLSHVAVSEPFDHAPRMLGLPGGVTLEVHDADGRFGNALERAGMKVSVAVRLQRRWFGVVLIVAVLACLLAVGYLQGLPAAARWLAFALPPRLESRMGEQFLAVLDKHYFRTSRLDSARRATIAERFARAASVAAPGVSYRLEFRSASRHDRKDENKDEINAMALPGGIIIMLDGLVNVAEADEVLAVLGHELGHVVAKHSTRQLFQSVGIGTLAGLLWGDFSGVAASVPVVIGLLRYSREFELEADDFAVTLLKTQNLSSEPLYDFFLRMQDEERERHSDDIPVFLSSHPSTKERLQRLNQLRQ